MFQSYLAQILFCLIVTTATASDPEDPIASSEVTYPFTERLIGKWEVIAMEEEGQQVPPGANRLKVILEFTKDQIIAHENGGKEAVAYKLNPEKTPCSIDMFSDPNTRLQGCCEIRDGFLRMCWRTQGSRPSGFKTRKDRDDRMVTLKRAP